MSKVFQANMEEKGIITIAFGKEYEKLAANCINYSRKYTNLPYQVVTNIKEEEREELWNNIDNVIFTYLNLPDYINRKIKTNIISYSKFNKTLFLDADSIIRKQGVENIFENSEFVHMRLLDIWKENDKIYNIYKQAMKKYKLKLPINIWHSSIILFDGYSWDFFDLWYRYWKDLNYTRDMPALNCMIQKEDIDKEINRIDDKYHSNNINNDSIIVHECNGFYEKYGIPKCKKDKSFDRKDDWILVNYD